MFFPSPSTWKMVKDYTSYVPMNMIGLAQTSRKILEDSDVPIFPVVLSTTDSLQFNCDCTGIPLSTFWMEVNTICIWPYIQCQSATDGIPYQDNSRLGCKILAVWERYKALLDHGYYREVCMMSVYAKTYAHSKVTVLYIYVNYHVIFLQFIIIKNI